MSKQTNRFKKAAPKASRLYKTGRYKTYGAAMKAALKGISCVGSSKKRTAKRKSVKRRRVSGRKMGAPVAVVHNGLNGVGIGSLKGELKKRLNDSIDRLVLQKYHAGKKRLKNKIQKSITAKKAELRKLL